MFGCENCFLTLSRELRLRLFVCFIVVCLDQSVVATKCKPRTKHVACLVVFA